MNAEDEKHELLFGVRRSIRYHNRRREFFETLNTSITALSLIASSATVYGVLQAQNLAMIAGATVTVLTAINLVIGSAKRAGLHHDLSRRFLALEKKMLGSPTPENLADWTIERLDIEADEPPVLRVLDLICHNELARAMGYEQKYFVKIAWYQRFFAQLFDVRDHAITA
jgi:hypothetical protein